MTVAIGAVRPGGRPMPAVGLKKSGLDPPLLLQLRLPAHGFHCNLTS